MPAASSKSAAHITPTLSQTPQKGWPANRFPPGKESDLAPEGTWRHRWVEKLCGSSRNAPTSIAEGWPAARWQTYPLPASG